MNALFVANKPLFVSSNNYVTKLRAIHRAKKAGFSGTLDPFACGNLIVAFGNYTKLFRFLKKTPKRYRAVIWLGVYSPSYDIENVQSVNFADRLDINLIQTELEKLKGEIEYTPPKYSAKKINGKKAYELARANRDFELKSVKMSVFDIELINYSHPFITFEVSVSEGAYIRSLAEMLSNRFERVLTLSYLERLSEGDFKFENHKFLKPTEYLDLEKNIYNSNMEDFLLGKKLNVEDFAICDDGCYFIEYSDFFSIIQIDKKQVKYILNKVEIC